MSQESKYDKEFKLIFHNLEKLYYEETDDEYWNKLSNQIISTLDRITYDVMGLGYVDDVFAILLESTDIIEDILTFDYHNKKSYDFLFNFLMDLEILLIHTVAYQKSVSNIFELFNFNDLNIHRNNEPVIISEDTTDTISDDVIVDKYENDDVEITVQDKDLIHLTINSKYNSLPIKLYLKNDEAEAMVNMLREVLIKKN